MQQSIHSNTRNLQNHAPENPIVSLLIGLFFAMTMVIAAIEVKPAFRLHRSGADLTPNPY